MYQIPIKSSVLANDYIFIKDGVLMVRMVLNASTIKLCVVYAELIPAEPHPALQLRAGIER